MKKTLWLSIGIFSLIVVAVLFFQQYRKNELITYLQALEARFVNLEPIQQLSLEANQAGMSGDNAKEAQLNAELLKLSGEFTASFTEIKTSSKTIKNLHDQLLALNESTHNLLVYRTEVLAEIKAQSLTEEEQKVKIERFWSIQEENKKLYQKFNDDLNKFAKRLGITVTDYAKHLP